MKAADERLRLLEWDTAFFGRRIAALTAPPRDEADLAQTIDRARAAGIECIYVLSDVGEQAAIGALSRRGARLVDVRMTFDRATRAEKPPSEHPSVRRARPEDVPALRELARASHGSSRFYADGRFPRELCDEMFAKWIENSCGGWAEVVRVADFDGFVAGYSTGHVRPNASSEIGLVAVDPRAQGQGLGARLVASTISDLRALGITAVSVVTQGRNIAAQRLYQSQGFRTQRVQTWHHMWMDELRP